MQKLFKINSSLYSYDVWTGHNLLQQAINCHHNIVLIYDKNLKPYLDHISSPKIAIEATEANKDLDNLSAIILQLKTIKINKDYQIVALGGGIIQDICCFIASIYMRGIKWQYFPTTLLGMADSCIGGKSSINASGIKNIVGNFYPPKEIYIDIIFLQTLNEIQYKSGLCEAVKICFAQPNNMAFNKYLELISDDHNKNNTLAIITLALSTKKWFIEQDEFDKKERQLLNFGHTFGHAIEAATNYTVPHGIAVGLGMLCACNLSNKIYTEFSIKGKERITALIKYLNILLKDCANIKMIYDNIDLILSKFELDKKHTISNYICIIPNSDGYLGKIVLPKTSKTIEAIKASFNFDKLIEGISII